jgi:hypothetical protein
LLPDSHGGRLDAMTDHGIRSPAQSGSRVGAHYYIKLITYCMDTWIHCHGLADDSSFVKGLADNNSHSHSPSPSFTDDVGASHGLANDTTSSSCNGRFSFSFTSTGKIILGLGLYCSIITIV